ncbi:MAG: hypothetical protein ACYC3I_02165 [Gemmataceae bacterium]
MSNTSAAQALSALGKPATPADESLALAYLRFHKADLQRKDKQPDSPVVKVRFTEEDTADDDLFFLSAFPQLRDLDLINCGEITDAGLTHLHTLKRLESVHLRGTKVTAKGIAELRKVFPKLDIAR